MPDEKNYELVDGHLEELSGSSRSSRFGGKIYSRLDAYAEANDLGYVWPSDTGFQCFPDEPYKIRKPDVSFIGRDRLPADIDNQGYIGVVPDLVVEVISPNEYGYGIEEKVADYVKAGVPLIWIIYPETGVTYVLRADSSARRVRSDEELSGESVLPGFALRLDSLFGSGPKSTAL
jgi:Uma2 family endonuclease